MDKNRLLMLLIGLGAAAVLAGGFVLGVQPSLQAAAESDAARQQAVATNALNQAALNTLIAQNKKVGELTGQLEELRLSIPATENMPAFIDAVGDAASAETLIVQNVTPADAIAYAPAGVAAPAAQPTPAPTSTPSSTPTPAPSATAAPPTASAQGLPIHSDPTITAANFLAIPVKIGVAGPLDRTIAFVHRLQDGSRLFTVSGISGGADSSATGGGSKGVAAAPSETYSVSGYVYVLAKAVAPAPVK
ncbi:hypothetical protein [Leifsonia sp. 2MCAF36]|uniref:hypothetical protein n=1 Tax=Leifsonia sp. 2MCAF36 TaxID=3232988 RepID=UPI003F9E9E52